MPATSSLRSPASRLELVQTAEGACQEKGTARSRGFQERTQNALWRLPHAHPHCSSSPSPPLCISAPLLSCTPPPRDPASLLKDKVRGHASTFHVTKASLSDIFKENSELRVRKAELGFCHFVGPRVRQLLVDTELLVFRQQRDDCYCSFCHLGFRPQDPPLSTPPFLLVHSQSFHRLSRVLRSATSHPVSDPPPLLVCACAGPQG